LLDDPRRANCFARVRESKTFSLIPHHFEKVVGDGKGVRRDFKGVKRLLKSKCSFEKSYLTL